MNKFLILLLIAVLALGLALTACNNDDDDDDDNNPTNAKWGVGIASLDAKTGSHGITVSWVGEQSDFVMPNSLALEIDGEPVSLDFTYSIWMADLDLNPGQEYSVKLIVNGDTKCDTSLRLVYEAVGTFPADYDPANAATVTWTLSNNNQKQFASATSFSPVKYQNDSFSQDISPSARSFTFPAGAVDDFGAMTSYTLNIDQMNSKTVDEVLLIASQSTSEQYTSFKSGADSRKLRAENFLRLARHAM